MITWSTWRATASRRSRRHVDQRESRTTSAEHRPGRDGGGADVPRVSGVDVHPLPQLRIEPPLVARSPRPIAPPRPVVPRP